MTITCSILWLLLIRFFSFTFWREDRLLWSLCAWTLYIFIDSLTLSFDEDDVPLLVELLTPLLSLNTLCCSTWELDKTDVDDGPVSGSGYSDEPEWLMPSFLWSWTNFLQVNCKIAVSLCKYVSFHKLELLPQFYFSLLIFTNQIVHLYALNYLLSLTPGNI